MSLREELQEFLRELKHNVSIPDSNTIDINYVIDRVQDILVENKE